MARITKVEFETLRTERDGWRSRAEAQLGEAEQLRALLAQEIELRKQWENDARRARRELVRRSHAAQTTVVAQSGALGTLARAYCEANGVRSCTREQALSMAGGA